MAISADDFHKINAHLSERWKGLCPTCRCADAGFCVRGYLPLLMSSNPDVVPVVSGDGVTLITVSCTHCGHTRFLDYHTATAGVTITAQQDTSDHEPDCMGDCCDPPPR